MIPWETLGRHSSKSELRLIERYPDQFTSDFDENKTLVERFTDVDNKKMRNWIAGYITRYKQRKVD